MIINEINSLSQIRYGHKPILIMLPFAGGNSYSYRGIIEHLEDTFDILCPELPGRGCLIDIPLKYNMLELVEYIFNMWIKPLNIRRPYILFGHSMGSLTVYLLLQYIQKNKILLPYHVIVSGSVAPSVKKDISLSHLPSSLFWNKLYARGGISDELYSSEELKEYFEPIIRADMEALESYSYQYQSPLEINLSVLYGSEENLSVEALQLWSIITTRKINIIELPGNHFFIMIQKEWFVRFLKNITINEIVES